MADAIRPEPDVKLDAHRVLLDLAAARGITRVVTTNFDLLFEACDPALHSSGPPSLPDPYSDRDFRGVVHLHGRVDATYRHAHDDEFVISSADFGRAYLSVGWATHFIQQLLSRFQVLFIGYTADDPPMQYLLEGLNLRAGTRNRLYAFQSGEQSTAIALWEHRGVKAIPFDNSDGFSPLWDTLGAWAERARGGRTWLGPVLTRAAPGPEHLAPHERGQVAHMLSIGEGVGRWPQLPSRSALSGSSFAPTLRNDTRRRYAPLAVRARRSTPSMPLASTVSPRRTQRTRRTYSITEDSGRGDRRPPTRTPSTMSTGRTAPARRCAGTRASSMPNFPPRLAEISVWLRRVAHQPVALWWAEHTSLVAPIRDQRHRKCSSA